MSNELHITNVQLLYKSRSGSLGHDFPSLEGNRVTDLLSPITEALVESRCSGSRKRKMIVDHGAYACC